ncbi:MAG: transporter substrate-binding domain-containing protein [Clostridia bacterium]|nr:transporter substrate-binding domain-containing protein [Clostridia bacterium]
MNFLLNFILDMAITMIAYLSVPVILCLMNKKFELSKIKKIISINSVVVWLIFTIIRIELGGESISGAVFLWSTVAYFLMKKRCLLVNKTEYLMIPENTQFNNTVRSIQSESKNEKIKRITKNGVFFGGGVLLIFFLSFNIIQYNELNNKKTFIVAVEDDCLPYSDEEKGVYYGIHIDIATEMANRLDLNVKFVSEKFENLISAVDSGKYDMALGIEKTDKREQIVSFTEVYYGGMAAIFSPKDFEEYSAIRQTMQEMIDDGTIKTIFNKYGIEYTPSINQQYYQLAKIITSDYENYLSEIDNVNALATTGTYNDDLKKEKVIDYINNLSWDYGQKVILFRIQYQDDHTYNNDIVDYLNERIDISYEEMEFVLEELGFAVFSDGSVKW